MLEEKSSASTRSTEVARVKVKVEEGKGLAAVGGSVACLCFRSRSYLLVKAGNMR